MPEYLIFRQADAFGPFSRTDTSPVQAADEAQAAADHFRRRDAVVAELLRRDPGGNPVNAPRICVVDIEDHGDLHFFERLPETLLEFTP